MSLQPLKIDCREQQFYLLNQESKCRFVHIGYFCDLQPFPLRDERI